MKLIRLKINNRGGFRSLKQGFEIFFLRDFHYDDATEFNPYLLAGTNGSGKSNVLEVLAEIFFHIDCIYLKNKPDYFDKSSENPDGFDPAKSKINSYELEYFIFLGEAFVTNFPSKKAHVKIIKKSNKRPKIYWLNKEEFYHQGELTQDESKSLLPDYVVGYASGNNETLSIPFFKSRFLQYDEYEGKLKSLEFIDPNPESSLVYLDEAFSQGILLTNLLMQNEINENIFSSQKDLLEPFKEYVGLEDIDSFRLIIRTDKNIEAGPELYNSENPPTREGRLDKIRLLQNLDLDSKSGSTFIRSYLEMLKRCATSWHNDYEEYFPEDSFESEVNNYLILDYKVNDATKKAFQFHFENNPLQLFELFQLLLVLDNNEVSIERKQKTYRSDNVFINNSIHQVPLEENRILRFKNFYLKKKNIKETIYTKSLSDGEHQFLHALGLCLLFKDKRALFLFDEPETHFNPDWKARFISSVRDCFENDKNDKKQTMREMLITTHSPYLISDSLSDYVQVFKKDSKTGKVNSVKRPDFSTFGCSVNKIGIRIFGMPNTIGGYAQRKLDELEKESERLEGRQDLENLVKRIHRELGDSVERVLLVNKIIDKIERI